jgi:hypothetical protein
MSSGKYGLTLHRSSDSTGDKINERCRSRLDGGSSTGAGRTKQALIATKLKIAKSNHKHSSERHFRA